MLNKYYQQWFVRGILIRKNLFVSDRADSTIAIRSAWIQEKIFLRGSSKLLACCFRLKPLRERFEFEHMRVALSIPVHPIQMKRPGNVLNAVL